MRYLCIALDERLSCSRAGGNLLSRRQHYAVEAGDRGGGGVRGAGGRSRLAVHERNLHAGKHADVPGKLEAMSLPRFLLLRGICYRSDRCHVRVKEKLVAGNA